MTSMTIRRLDPLFISPFLRGRPHGPLTKGRVRVGLFISNLRAFLSHSRRKNLFLLFLGKLGGNNGFGYAEQGFVQEALGDLLF